MLNINIKDDVLSINNIQKESIKHIYNIYRNANEFKYATGIFNQIEFDQFLRHISQFILRNNIFFVGISLTAGETIGLIKGTVIPADNIVWINSFAITTLQQSKGYGKRAIDLLENHFKEEGVKKIYLSVYKNNESGIKFWNKCGYGKFNNINELETKKLNEFVQIMCKIL